MTITRKPLVEFASIGGKKCQNSIYEWHRFPKTRHKKDSFYHDDEELENDNTFIIVIKKTKAVGIFCYHCFLSFIGQCIRDLKKAGATKEEINDWLLPLPNKRGKQI